MMRFWPFRRRRVTAETQSAGLPPVVEAAPTDMARFLTLEDEETVAIAGARRRLTMLGIALGFAFSILGGRAIMLAVAGETGPVQTIAAADAPRGDLVDRNGNVLATTLQTWSLYADPTEVWDAEETARALATVLPDLDVDRVTRDLSTRRRFVWVQRNLTPRQRQAVFSLGLPGLDFRTEPRRVYPRGRLAAHVVGYSDRDLTGIAGAERAFQGALEAGDGRPVALSIDMGVQYHVDEVLRGAMQEFRALAAVGVVMDVRTGEVLSMVSLPDYDANRPAEARSDDRLNRATQAVYEMGSTFKAFTVALALETGVARPGETFDASNPLRIGGHTIHDYHAQNRELTLSEIFTHSSNIGSSLMALEAGAEAQRDLLQRLRLLEAAPIELAETSRPILPRNWGPTETATISYGHGVAVSPLSVAAAFAAIANGGVYVQPTLQPVRPGETVAGEQVLDPDVAQHVLDLMREVVAEGTGRRAEVPGYLVAGKTGTAEKPGRGGYDRNRLISSFSAVFPYNDPQYVVLVMLDEPHGNSSTYGYATAGYVAAPAAGAIIERIAPILGVDRVDDPLARAALVRAALSPDPETPAPRIQH